ALYFDVHSVVVFSNRQPGFTVGKSGVLCRAPLHRSSLGIATQTAPRNIFLERVLDLFRGNLHVMHADLIAVVKRRRAAQGEQQHRCQPRLCWTDPGRNARPVVVSKNPVRPATLRQRRLVFPDDASDITSLPLREKELKVKREVDAPKIRAIVLYKSLDGQ